MPNNQELRLQQTQMLPNQDFHLQQTQMLSHQDFRLQQTQMLPNQDFRSAQAILSPKQEHHNYTSARSLPSRAQNRGFCAFLPKIFPIFRPFEHKIEVFVRFWGLEPSFSGFSSTKSAFLCAFCLRNPRFRAFEAQNRGFCALLPASFFPIAPRPATNLIRRRKVLRFS